MVLAETAGSPPSHRTIRSLTVPSARLEIRKSFYPERGSGMLVVENGMLELSLSGRTASGEIYFHREERRRLGGRVGELVYIPANMRFEGVWKSGTEINLCCLFSESTGLCGEPWCDQELARSIAIKSPLIASLARQVRYELENLRPYRELAIEGICLQIAAELGRERKFTQSISNLRSLSGAEEFSRVVRSIEAESAIPCLKTLAEGFGCSERHLGKLFIENTGKTFSRFVVELKIERARYLLLNTTRAIKDISFDLGYNVAADFTRAFRKEVGVSPTLYRSGGGAIAKRYVGS